MNYIIKYAGGKEPDEKKLQQVIRQFSIKVIDDTMFPKMGLVSMDDRYIEQVKIALDHQWDLFPEKRYNVPDTRKRLKK